MPSPAVHLVVRLVNNACTKLEGKEVLLAELEILLEDGVQTLAA